MNINDFRMPTEHPWSMLKDYNQGNEKEQMLVFMLAKCIEAKDIDAEIKTTHAHPTMVLDGLLEEVGNTTPKYKLTDKSKELLLVFYPTDVEKSIKG